MIMLSKNSIAASGDSFFVRGAGFIPGEPVQLTLMIDPNNSILLGDEVQVNAAGAFSVEIADTGVSDASGYFTVMAEGADGSLASAPIRIASSIRMSR